MPRPRAIVKDRAAENDLIEIWVYTYCTWGEAQAESYLDTLESAVASLAENPTVGRSRDAIRAGYWSRSIEHHVVFYTFSETELRIRRVLHEAMDFGVHFQQ